MSPSARDMFAYGSMTTAMLMMNALGDEDLLLSRSQKTTDYVYNGCLQKGLPAPLGVTPGGISSYLAQVAYPQDPADDKLAADQVRDVLFDLKRLFNLTTSDLADVCRVTRPTIYAWMKGGNIEDGNLTRLDLLNGLAKHWAANMRVDVFSAPRVPESPDFKEMLCMDTLDEPALRRRLDSLAETAREREARRPKTGRELAEEHGMEPLSEDAQERNMMMVRLSAGSGR